MRGLKLRYELFARIKNAGRELDAIVKMMPKTEKKVFTDLDKSKLHLANAGATLRKILDEFETKMRRK